MTPQQIREDLDKAHEERDIHAINHLEDLYTEENHIAYMEITGGHEEFDEDFDYIEGKPFQAVEVEAEQIKAHNPAEHEPPEPPF